jgi:acyl-CoA thioester hydrolase
LSLPPPPQDTRPSAGWFEGHVHCLPVRVYYEDTDFTGLVYHANYVRYFERGRSDFLRLIGADHTLLLEREDPAAFVVTRIELDFKSPARIDDALLVRTTYDSFRGARLSISQRIWRGDTLLADAQVHAACIDLQGRPRRPPAVLVEKVRPWLTPPPDPA